MEQNYLSSYISILNVIIKRMLMDLIYFTIVRKHSTEFNVRLFTFKTAVSVFL